MLQRACRSALAGAGKLGGPSRLTTESPRLLAAHAASVTTGERQAPKRGIQTSSRCRAEKVKTSEAERQLLKEVQQLRLEALDASAHEGGPAIAKNDLTLPQVTEDDLDLIYEALQMPEPATEEELEQEARRLRRLERIGTDRGAHLQSIKDKASRQLIDLAQRLQTAKRYLEEQSETGDDDASAKILKILSHRGDERAETRRDDLLGDLGEGPAAKPDLESSHLTAPFSHSLDSATKGKSSPQDFSIQDLLESISAVSQGFSDLVPDGDSDLTISRSILTASDWKSIFFWLALDGSVGRMDDVLAEMGRCGNGSEQQVAAANAALLVFANGGQVDNCMLLYKSMQDHGLTADGTTKHCLVKSLTRSSRFDEAIALIQSYEETIPAGLWTYSSLIQALLTQRSDPVTQSKAWSVFKQMRFAAHPVPDATLYARMITACAHGVAQPDDDVWRPKTYLTSPTPHKPTSFTTVRRTSDAERALDLFREMTIRYRIRPTPEVYAAIIFACARRKGMYLTAIKLFQSMLEHERQRIKAERFGDPSFAPDRFTCNALLRGCAKNADLVRARWILAEMLRSSLAQATALKQRGNVTKAEVEETKLRRPDADTLASVFFTYASHDVSPDDVPVVRRANRERMDRKASSQEIESSNGSEADGAESRAEDLALEKDNPLTDTQDERAASFSEQIPLTSRAILQEVLGLMERIRSDVEAGDGLLSSVKPNALLLSAFLSVIAKHSWGFETLGRIRHAMFGLEEGEDEGKHDSQHGGGWLPFMQGQSLYERWAIPLDARACSIALEACSKGRNRKLADELADKVWSTWLDISDKMEMKKTGDGTGLRKVDDQTSKEEMVRADPEHVSKCWGHMIRSLTRSGRLDDAMHQLRMFADRYPPSSHNSVKLHASAGKLRASGRELERPILTFPQLESLYEQLKYAIAGRQGERAKWTKELNYLTYISHAYSADLYPRKPSVLRRTHWTRAEQLNARV